MDFLSCLGIVLSVFGFRLKASGRVLVSSCCHLIALLMPSPYPPDLLGRKQVEVIKEELGSKGICFSWPAGGLLAIWGI